MQPRAPSARWLCCSSLTEHKRFVIVTLGALGKTPVQAQVLKRTSVIESSLAHLGCSFHPQVLQHVGASMDKPCKLSNIPR
eukprot:2214623-Amphidinium_carterae.1